MNSKDKKIAMYCTGGIRCEKASNYLIEQGFENVYQLKGGILQYFEDNALDENLWQGECFVFDNRVSVNKKLEKGQYDQCYGCRSAITEEDKKHRHYEPGVVVITAMPTRARRRKSDSKRDSISRPLQKDAASLTSAQGKLTRQLKSTASTGKSL